MNAAGLLLARVLAVAGYFTAPSILRAPSPRLAIDDGLDNDYYKLRFDGVRRLYGDEAPARLKAARVVVVGLGGVGTWAVEALARSGIGALVLVDLDEICISNTNRQLHALRDTVGKSKAQVLAARVAEINPECEVVAREEWVLAENALELLRAEQSTAEANNQQLALLDAVDGYREKAAMVDAARELDVHLVIAGAAGGKSDPTAVTIADLTQVSNDALLKRVRQELRKEYGYPAGQPQHKGSRSSGGSKRKPAAWGVPCAYSTEPPTTFTGGDIGSVCDQFGTACFGVGAFGFAAASYLTKAIATSAPLPKRPRVVVQPAASTKLKAEPVEPLPALYDSHCHALAAAAEDEEEAHDVSGVCLISAGESDWSVAAAAEGRRGGSGRKYAIGVHPWYAHTQDDGWEDRLRSALDSDANAIVGETGLDRARLEECPWEGQLHAFTTQLRLASELKRPLVVHCVRADGPMIDLLNEEASSGSLPPVVIMHAYGGSAETATSLLRLAEQCGSKVFFGYSGRAARTKRAPSVIASLPADRLLIESDEHTADAAKEALVEACERVAEARGWSEAETAERTAENARVAFELLSVR